MAHHHPEVKSPVSPVHGHPKFPLHNVEIYPPIGIARVGNSRLDSLDHGWFYGPENPGHFDEPKGGFKDEHGAVKRQVKLFFSSQLLVLPRSNIQPCSIWSGRSIPSLWN